MILWLAIRGKLNSQDKLISQGVIQANTCVLCNTHPEDLNHLFFSCDFSDFIWRSLWAKCSQTWSHRSWEDTVAWLSGNYHSSSLFCIVVRLMFAAAVSVYCIWREGNSRLFSRKSKNPSSVLQDIIFWVRSRVNPLGDLDPPRRIDCSLVCGASLRPSWNLSSFFFLFLPFPASLRSGLSPGVCPWAIVLVLLFFFNKLSLKKQKASLGEGKQHKQGNDIIRKQGRKRNLSYLKQ